MVTEIATPKNSYQELFRALQGVQPEGRASWITRLRENAMARFEELGFPTTKDEEWKYTNVAGIARTDFTPWLTTENATSGSAANELATFGVAEAKDSQLV